jgi:hypothetical protein
MTPAVYANSILFPTAETSQYLMIGTGNGQTGDAINVQKTELGADQIFVSDFDPNLVSVFAGRWSSSTNSTTGTVPASAPVGEGIDYTGQNAVTSDTGGFTYSNTAVYADGFAVRCASSATTSTNGCLDNMSSPANSLWYTSGGGLQGDIGDGFGVVGDYNHDGLIDELEAAWSYINGLTAEFVISADLENGSGSLDIDLLDTNSDGLAVIDISKSGDWNLNNYDWILNGDGSTFAIFRILGDTNMLMSNSSIALGPGGIGGGSAILAPSYLGALFVQYQAPDGNTDQVFNFNNVILNGAAFWDLNAFQDGVYDDSWNTELNVQNGQGCSQFISSSVTHTSSVRWTGCSFAPTSEPPPVPEPGTFLLLASGAAGLAVRRRIGRRSC